MSDLDLSLRARFQTGLGFNTLGAVFNQGSTFVVNIVLARLFGRAVFGEYAMVLSTILTLGILSQFGIPFTLTKYVSEYRSANPERAGRILGTLSVISVAVAGAAALGLLFVAPWLASNVMNSPALTFPCAIGAVVLFLLVLNGFAIAALTGLERYRALAISLVWSGVAYFLLCTGFAWRGGINGAFIGLALSGAIQFVFLSFAVRKECLLQGIKLRFDGFSRERHVLLRFALPAGLTGFTAAPALWLPNAFLVRQSAGYSQMGTYSVAFSLMTAILFLPSIANSVGTSLINHHQGSGKSVAYQRTFWINLIVTACIVVIGSGSCALLGPWLLRFFGRDFKDGYSVLLILCLAAIPQGLVSAMYQIIQSHAKMWISFLGVAVPRDLLTIGLAYFLIPTHGANGLAVAYALSWTLAFLITVFIVSRIGLAPVPVQAAMLLPAER